MNYKKIFTGLLFAIITIISTGCGESSFFDKADDTSSSSIMLHGNVAKGPIYKAEVRAFRLDTNKLLNTAQTDAKGDYSLDIGTYTGAIKITAKGGSYIDEISGEEQDTTKLILEAISVISDDEKVKTVNITPVTDIAAQELEDMYEDIIKLAKKQSIITDVNINIARILTGSSFNPTKVKPKILGKDKIELNDGDAGEYGIFLAVFAKLSKSDVSNVKEKIEKFYNDIKDNSVLSEDSNTKIKDALEDDTIKKGINTDVITSIENQQKTYDVTPAISGTLIKTNQKIEGKTEFTLSVKDIDTKVLVHFKNKKSFATFEAKDENGKDIVFINNDSKITVTIINSDKFEETRKVILLIGKTEVLLSSTTTATVTIKDLKITSTATIKNTYKKDADINITVEFTKEIEVVLDENKKPSIVIKVGNADKLAYFKSFSGSDIIFTYKVKEGDNDINGISVPKSEITLNGATIKTTNGINTDNNYNTLEDNENHKVDAKVPTLTGVAITSNAGDNNTYGIGNTIIIEASFSENITSTDAKIIINITNDRTLSAESFTQEQISTGTNKLIFKYKVEKGDEDIDGISVHNLTGTIIDTVGNKVKDFTFEAITNNASHKITTATVTIKDLKITPTASIKNTYKKDADINITVEFTKEIEVVLNDDKDKPHIVIKVGNADKLAYFKSFSGSDIIFTYKVKEGDNDINGISVPKSEITLNGATIKTTNGINTDNNYNTLEDNENHKVDAKVPTLTGVAITSNAGDNNTYGIGNTIIIEASFSENITSTDAKIIINITNDRTLSAESFTQEQISTGTNKLIFKYKVEKGDEDIDGISVHNLTGTIIDTVGNKVKDFTFEAITNNASHKITTATVTIKDLKITSTATIKNTYKKDADINITVEFTKEIEVVLDENKKPSIVIKVGNADKLAYFKSFSGSDIIFTYKVKEGDNDINGISVPKSEITLNGATIKTTNGINTDNNYNTLEDNENHKVDAKVPTLTGVAITSNAGDNNTYGIGNTIIIEASFSENITSTDAKIIINITNDRTLSAESFTQEQISTGTNKLIFKYKVEKGDEDIDGISVHNLTGTIIDTVGNKVKDFTFEAITNNASHKITTATVTIKDLKITSTATIKNTYKKDADINITVEFTKEIEVVLDENKKPSIVIKVGNADKLAYFKSFSGSDIIFTYKVKEGDNDINGISVPKSEITLNGATIKTTNGINTDNNYNTLEDNENHKVDAKVPTLTGVAITSNAGDNNTYGIGNTIIIEASFSENITSTDAKIIINITNDRTLSAESFTQEQISTGTNKLIFKYKVEKGDEDIDGISVHNLTGTIIDTVGNKVKDFTFEAITNNASHKITTATVTIKDLKITSTATIKNTYKKDADINITVEFTKEIEVVLDENKKPSIVIKVGNADKLAYFKSFSGSDIIFTYKVKEGDNDINGISVPKSEITLNGATIKTTNGINTDNNYNTLEDNENHKVDAKVPTLTGVAITSNAGDNNTYGIGNTIIIEASFSENITSTDAKIIINITNDRTLSAESFTQEQISTGTNKLIFKYKVEKGDEDIDGISVHNLTGTIIDTVGNKVKDFTFEAITNNASHKITTATVTIKDLKITSTATIKNTYKKDADINITVEFTKEIEVVLDENKKPSIVIKVGNADKLAYFKSFSGSDIIFTYKVKEGDNDINGISVPKSEITLNGATIKTTNGINTDNNYNTLEDNENHKVDAKVPTLTGVAITSNAGDNNTYGIGNTIIIEASFSENITSTDAKIIINITNDRTLSAESFTQEQISTGTNKLIFKYKVEKGDEDIDGISVHNLTGTIIDTVGNKVKDFTFEAITNNASHKITTATVTIKDLKITSTATIKNTYKKDADINITVEFTKEIEVVLDENKKPSIVIKVGNADKLAYFKSFSGSDIIFTYKVKEGDNDINGISVPKSEITLNGATIKTTNGINTDNNYNTLEDNENHKVDAKVPTLTGVAITSNAGDNNTYGIGNTIIIEASFSENITSTDAKIIINITNDRTLSAESFTQEQISTGTNKLIFKYKVEKGDEDIDGISVHNLTGTIIDTVGNKVKDFTFEAITNNASHKITTATVTIKDLKITSTATIKNTYKKDADINITVEFTKEIEVVLDENKKPSIVIKVGNADKLAYFKSFSGSDIIFTYKVKEGDNDINGISVPKSEITLNGATIKTTNGINTDNNYNTLEDNENHKVDAKVPTLTGVAITSNAGDNNTYGIGNTIIIEASFSENITSTDAKIIINITNDRTLSAESFTQEQISTGTNKLIFKYKVEKGDEDIDGISVHNLTGTIIDTVGNKVKDFTFEAITNNASHKITTATVTIKDLKITSTATIKNTYKKDADINITVEFTKEIEVVLDENKKPSIVIKVGNADKLAYFKSFSGSDIIFTYKVKEGDNDINGISVPKSEITLNGATIKTTNGINTDNNYNTLEDNENHKVDAKVPTLTGVAITSNAGDNNTYGIGNTIIIEASFSENITSTDAKIIINITNDRTLSAESFTQEQISTGTNKLIFKYKVEKGDEDIDGISVHNLTGTIIDTVGNKVKDFTFEAITNNASHKITTATVTIKDLKITSTATIKNTYKKDADINITVEFTKEIEVVLDENKKPSIVIKVGNADKLAYFKSFSGSDIIFTYKVKEGDNDINGISVPKSEITLNGATIKTTNGINTDNNYNTLEDNENHKVDAITPVLTFTNKNVVNSNFTITVTANKQMETLNVAKITANNGVTTNTEVTSSGNAYTISFVISSTTKEGDIVITFANGAIKDTYGNENNSVTVTIKYDITPPTLIFTSHKDNQLIGKNEALNLTLIGTTDAENEQKVHLSIGKEVLGTATVLTDDWKKENIELKLVSKMDSNNIIFAGASATRNTFTNLFDGNKEYSYPTAFSVEQNTNQATFLIIRFKEAKIINSLRVWIDSHFVRWDHNREMEKVSYRFLGTDGKAITTFKKGTITEKDFTYEVFSDTSKKISQITMFTTGEPDKTSFTFSELEIYVKNIEHKITAKVKDEAGNETSKDLNLKIVDVFTLLSDSVKEGGALDKKYSFDALNNDSNRKNISPQLKWGAAPAGTKSYAIIMDDTTANNFIHWNVFNIPKSITSFKEGWSANYESGSSDIIQNTAEGITEPANQYVGPWPPSSTHTYQIKIYALNIEILENNTSTQNTVAFESTYGENGSKNILGSTTLTFTFTP